MPLEPRQIVTWLGVIINTTNKVGFCIPEDKTYKFDGMLDDNAIESKHCSYRFVARTAGLFTIFIFSCWPSLKVIYPEYAFRHSY